MTQKVLEFSGAAKWILPRAVHADFHPRCRQRRHNSRGETRPGRCCGKREVAASRQGGFRRRGRVRLPAPRSGNSPRRGAVAPDDATSTSETPRRFARRPTDLQAEWSSRRSPRPHAAPFLVLGTWFGTRVVHELGAVPDRFGACRRLHSTSDSTTDSLAHLPTRPEQRPRPPCPECEGVREPGYLVMLNPTQLGLGVGWRREDIVPVRFAIRCTRYDIPNR